MQIYEEIKIKGLRKETHRHRQQHGDYSRGRGWMEVEKGIRGIMVIKGKLTWGGELTME